MHEDNFLSQVIVFTHFNDLITNDIHIQQHKELNNIQCNKRPPSQSGLTLIEYVRCQLTLARRTQIVYSF